MAKQATDRLGGSNSKSAPTPTHRYSTRSRGALPGSVNPGSVDKFTNTIAEAVRRNLKTKSPKSPSNKVSKAPVKVSKAPAKVSSPPTNISQSPSEVAPSPTKVLPPLPQVIPFFSQTSQSRKGPASPLRGSQHGRPIHWHSVVRHQIERNTGAFLRWRLPFLEAESKTTPDGRNSVAVPVNDYLHDDDVLRAIHAVTEAITNTRTANGQPPLFSFLSQGTFTASTIGPSVDPVARPQRALFMPSIVNGHHRLALITPSTTKGLANLTWCDSATSPGKLYLPPKREQTELLRHVSDIGWFGNGATGAFDQKSVARCARQVDGWSCGAMCAMYAWTFALGMKPATSSNLPQGFGFMLCRLLDLASAGHLDRWCIYAVLRREGLIDADDTLAEDMVFTNPGRPNRTVAFPTHLATNEYSSELLKSPDTSGPWPGSLSSGPEVIPFGHLTRYNGPMPKLTWDFRIKKIRQILLARGLEPEEDDVRLTEQFMRVAISDAGETPSDDDLIRRFQFAILQRADRKGVHYSTYFS